MISKGRIILRSFEFLAHYSLIFSLGTINLLMIAFSWNQAPIHPSSNAMTNKDIIIWTAIDLLLMTAFYFIQRDRLKLEKETIDLEDDQIFEVINEVGEKFDWTRSSVTKRFIQADSLRIFGTDNKITIFIKDKDIYINCRATFGQIGGFFRQAKITDEFFKALRMRSHELHHQKKDVQKQASR